MMTKKQKIWMWIFVAMFAIPEILWSPIVNFLHIFSKGGNIPIILRDNFLFNYEYDSLLKSIISIQFIGVILFLVCWFKNKGKIKSKFLFWVVSVLSIIFCLVSFFILYLIMATQNIGF